MEFLCSFLLKYLGVLSHAFSTQRAWRLKEHLEYGHMTVMR